MPERRSANKPNVILIFCDDLGYGDLGCYGHPLVDTPNIDNLADNGQRFTSFYAAGCICVASRLGIMTGRFRARHDDEPGLPSTEYTLGQMFRDNGYRTACMGKWHMGINRRGVDMDFAHPNDRGFDYFYGTPSSNDHYAQNNFQYTYDGFKHARTDHFNVPMIRQKEILERPARQDMFTQRYTRETVNWIKENRDSPFFVYLAHNMPHVPLIPNEKFKDKSLAGVYGDVVQEIDWSVGEIVKTLEEEGLSDNTLIIFTSDNGPWRIYHELGGTAGPFRNGKGTCWEGGDRVPAILYWPSKIQPGVNHEMISALDFFPTMTNLVGGEIPADRKYDGMDVSTVIFQQRKSKRNIMFHYHESGGLWAVTKGKYKVHFTTVPFHRATPEIHEKPLIFDLQQDFMECGSPSGNCGGHQKGSRKTSKGYSEFLVH